MPRRRYQRYSCSTKSEWSRWPPTSAAEWREVEEARPARKLRQRRTMCRPAIRRRGSTGKIRPQAGHRPRGPRRHMLRAAARQQRAADRQRGAAHNHSMGRRHMALCLARHLRRRTVATTTTSSHTSLNSTETIHLRSRAVAEAPHRCGRLGRLLLRDIGVMTHMEAPQEGFLPGLRQPLACLPSLLLSMVQRWHLHRLPQESFQRSIQRRSQRRTAQRRWRRVTIQLRWLPRNILRQVQPHIIQRQSRRVTIRRRSRQRNIW
mmetsp:Transcript_23992/g.66716  ORF Transcript_23992/g.66716 Transcript_23992/m.66716 type:complete len:263 (-) Transcript_23992:323-1111(-)